MQSILEGIRLSLLAIQGPLVDLSSTFPRALIIVTFLSIVITKQVLCLLDNIKK